MTCFSLSHNKHKMHNGLTRRFSEGACARRLRSRRQATREECETLLREIGKKIRVLAIEYFL
jgi:hypothetical protein